MLKIKHIPINSFNENIVYLHKKCSEIHVENIKSLTKMEINGGITSIFAHLQVIDDDSLLSLDEVGLNTEAFKQINHPEGAGVSINIAMPADSLSYVKKKISGNVLSAKEYQAIINDIGTKRYSNMDVTAFLVASGSFMSASEVLALTEALIGDKKISWDNENIVVDHHCLGGVPGNKTDIIIAAIVSAYGLPIPKTASRSLTACAGVADTFSVLCNVDLDEQSLRKIIKENRGAIACYDGLDIAGVNKLISSIGRQVGIIQQEYLIASILAIKIAAGVTHLLIDIPVGANARVKNSTDALHIRKLIEHVGDQLSLEVEVVITDGREPIGNGIGAVLEARDIMKVLRNKDDAPQDLLEKSLFLAGKILEFDPKLRGGQGYHVAKELLESGKALESLNRIIHAQGQATQPHLGHLNRDVLAPTSGTIEAINNIRINKIGILAGAQKHQGAGLDLLKKIGDKVEQGEVLYRLHSCDSTDFAFANSTIDGNNGYEIK